MPFASNEEVRRRVAGAKDWSERETTIFREAFNSAFDGTCKEQHGDEPEQRENCAFGIAHAARKRST